MAKTSAGILMYRGRGERLEVFLVHPGGPFWARKDQGAWTIPKGEPAAGEEPLAALSNGVAAALRYLVLRLRAEGLSDVPGEKPAAPDDEDSDDDKDE